MPPSNEATTRRELIDPALRRVGWNVSDPEQVRLEIPVTGYDPDADGGIADYCLYMQNGEVIAIVEAKKQSRNPNVAREQVRQYAEQIAAGQSFQPFAFLSNGVETYFWDIPSGAPRLVVGFFSLSSLERLKYLREAKLQLAMVAIDTRICERPYQHEAIRRVTEAFEAGKRRGLLVMATGTGKTRTTVGLVDVFLRANQARRVLFLADRDALVDQALNDGFGKFLPDEPNHRIWTHDVDPTKRLYVATLQTMTRCYTQIDPSFFDLIVFDEAHRSIYNRLGEVMEYFDARMIGLTATPAEFVDRDTFRLFDCTDRTPTFLYTYQRAVMERHLVDFSLYQAQTRFLRDGIIGADLTEEEQNTLIEQGIDPDEIDYSGSDIERTVSVPETLRSQLEELMDVGLRDESGQYLGKTIIFAITKDHAERLRQAFEQTFPQYYGFVTVITSDTERVRDGAYGPGLLTQFKRNNFPRIAISVDMLDTGVDVPEVVNLAFMKPVKSRIKLWQMVGRGTRNDDACRFKDRLPDGRKTEFKVIDFWQNDFERKAEAAESPTVPVLVTIFNTRLRLLDALGAQQNGMDGLETKTDLRQMVAAIPLDAFPVRRVYPEIASAWTDEFWSFLSNVNMDFLRTKVGPLLKLVANVDVAQETFTSKVERLRLQIATGRVEERTLTGIAEDVGRLPTFIQQDPQYREFLDLCLSPQLPDAPAANLRRVITNLAPLMRLRMERDAGFQTLNLDDLIVNRGYVTLSDSGEQVYVADYRQRVEQRIDDVIADHPTIRAIERGEIVTDLDLVELERTLRLELGGRDIELTTGNIRKAYGLQLNSFLAFARHVLGVEGMPDYDDVVRHAFAEHVQQHNYSADQIQFLRSVQAVFLQKRRLALVDLYEAPLTSYGDGAVERFFTAAQITDLLDFTGRLALAA